MAERTVAGPRPRRLDASEAVPRASWCDLGELFLAVGGFLCYFYFLVRGGVVTRPAEAVANARLVIDLETHAGVFVEHELQRWALAWEPAWRLANFVYFWLDFPLIVAVGLLLFARRRGAYALLRDSMLLSGAGALVVYLVFPVAPPRLVPGLGFVDTLQQYASLSYQAQSLAPFVNPFAAVPSLHVGWSMLLALAVRHATEARLARLAAVAVGVCQVFAVIATANHFLFDGAIGIVISGAAWGFALAFRGLPGPRQVWRASRESDPGRPSAAG